MCDIHSLAKSPNKWCRFCGKVFWTGSRRWPEYCCDACAKKDADDYERTESSKYHRE